MGRRIKYETEYERLEAIRRSKRLHIKKKRKLKKLADLIYDIQLKNTKEYKDNIVEWNLGIGYDVFQTVTFIRFDNGMTKTKDAYYNIDYVANEVKKYIKSMFNTGNLKNAFWTIEQHEDLSWHSHITLKFWNDSQLDRIKFSERMWTKGISRPLIIESQTEDLRQILEYMLKDVKADYTNINALYWNYLSHDEYIEENIPITFKRYLNTVLEEVEIEALKV